MNSSLVKSLGFLAGLASCVVVGTPASASDPDAHEVYQLVRSNLTGVSDADLNRAALQGLLTQYRSEVLLVTNVAEASASSTGEGAQLLTQTRVYDERYAYLRIGRVAAGLADRVSEAVTKLAVSNRLAGLVLDLRFGEGQDYAAAAQTADRFLTTQRPLLSWGETTARSTTKTNAFSLPAAILVNRRTTGAAEALAAVLRRTEVGLLLGQPTAGRAHVFKDYPLSGGQVLRLAVVRVRLGEDEALPAGGLTPDIQVEVEAEDEARYWADPYWAGGRSLAASATRRPPNPGTTGTNRPARINEADLVRMRRNGQELDEEGSRSAPRATGPTRPLITDPVLARALDLLKGLAVIQPSRRP